MNKCYFNRTIKLLSRTACCLIRDCIPCVVDKETADPRIRFIEHSTDWYNSFCVLLFLKLRLFYSHVESACLTLLLDFHDFDT